jgi:hypothetical protein
MPSMPEGAKENADRRGSDASVGSAPSPEDGRRRVSLQTFNVFQCVPMFSIPYILVPNINTSLTVFRLEPICSAPGFEAANRHSKYGATIKSARFIRQAGLPGINVEQVSVIRTSMHADH